MTDGVTFLTGVKTNNLAKRERSLIERKSYIVLYMGKCRSYENSFAIQKMKSLTSHLFMAVN